jgi:hypothetical protein
LFAVKEVVPVPPFATGKVPVAELTLGAAGAELTQAVPLDVRMLPFDPTAVNPVPPPAAPKVAKDNVPLPFVTIVCPAVPSEAGNVKVVVAAVLGPAKLTAPPSVA